MADDWSNLERSSPPKEAYEPALAERWQLAGCTADGAPYVVRGFLKRLDSWFGPFAENSPEPANLAKAFLDPEKCPGARGLTEAEIAKLKEIRDRAVPPATKP